MKTCIRPFKFTHADGRRDEVLENERITDDHELVKMFPDCWRNFTLDDELRVRSTRVSELREQAERPAGREPLSRAGREARKQDDFWRSTTAMLERTRDDLPSAAERREEDFYDRALQQMEDLEAARMRGELEEINGMYYGRLEE